MAVVEGFREKILVVFCNSIPLDETGTLAELSAGARNLRERAMSNGHLKT